MDDQIKVKEELLDQAVKLTGEKDREKVVEQALQELIQRRSKLQALLDIAGKIEFYEGYDYKALRKTRYDDS